MKKIIDADLPEDENEVKADKARAAYLVSKGINQEVATPEEARDEMIKRKNEAHKKKD